MEGIRDEIEAMLRASPEPNAEKFAIHDFENFDGLELHQYENLEHVARAAELIVEHGEKAACYSFATTTSWSLRRHPRPICASPTG